MLNRKDIILFTVSAGVFFEALDVAIVNLAMPLMKETFNLSSEGVQWVQTLYIICYGGFLVIGGKMADEFGRKRIFLIGSWIFLLTSFGAALSDSFVQMIAFRAVQGIGAALVIPSAFSIVTTMYTDPNERNKAVGLFGSFAGIGSGSGLSVGGLIATYFGWRWIFFINVPVIMLVLALGYRYIEAGPRATRKGGTDFVSAVCLTLVILTTSFLVHELTFLAGNLPLMVLTIVGLILLTIVFLKRSRRENPLIDFSLLRHHSVATANGNVFLMGAFFTSFLFLIALVMQSEANLTAARAGVLLLPFSIMSALISKWAMPLLLKRISLVQGAILGMLLMLSGGLALLIASFLDFPLLLLLLSACCVTGTGIAVCFMTLNVMGVQSIPQHHHGLATSLITTSFFFGGGVGMSLIGLSMQFNSYAPFIVLTSYAAISVIWLTVEQRTRRLDVTIL